VSEVAYSSSGLRAYRNNNTNERHESTRITYGATHKKTQMKVTGGIAPSKKQNKREYE
jgi:hypothetical protein